MIKEFKTQQSEFIYSKDELGYQKVLDEFPTAKEIIIITYNISEKQTFLLNCIKSACNDTKITIVTNIPNRWEKYYSDNYRELAKKKIDIYMTKLAPDYISKNASVFFDFNNHGKIIMTDTIAYIGSSNYSEESKNNSEFGFIIKDNEFITFLKSEVLPEIEMESVPYDEYNYTGLVLEANMVLSAIFNLQNELHEETYSLHDDIDGDWFYYNEHEDTLDIKTLDSIKAVLVSSNEIASDIYDAVSNITDSNDNNIEEINDLYEKLWELSRLSENYIITNEVYELANFEYNDYLCYLLEKDYTMEAYEDNLENCIEKASVETSDFLLELCTNARDAIDGLLGVLKEYQEVFLELINKFSRYNIKKVNPEIDNT